MSSEPRVSLWLDQLKAGDRFAAQQLWEVYYHRLVGLARAKLQGARRLGADEEDVALSAFDSFCRRAERGQFPRLDDRDDLWQVLFVLGDQPARELSHSLDLGERSLVVLPGETDGGQDARRIRQPLDVGEHLGLGSDEREERVPRHERRPARWL